MNLLDAVILGIVEGVTEFLPVSSTGHLMLGAFLLRLSQSDFLKSFEIAIQLGAILSVVVLYYRSFLLDRAVIKRLAVAFIPTAVVGVVLYKVIKQYFLSSMQLVLWSLFLGGIALIIFELFHREKESAVDDVAKVSYGQSLCIGLFQSLAVIPGVSRAAATIVGGLLVGLKRKTIVEFSFLLAVPTMLAATVFDLVKSPLVFNADQYIFLAVGFLVSFAVAIVAIKTFLSFIGRHTFIPFGVYRIVVVLVFLIFMR